MVNDNLESRGLYTSLFPEDANTVIPKLGINTPELADMTMPIPFDTNVTPTRKLKKNFKNAEKIVLKDEGFNFIVRLTSNAGFANLYMLVKIGSPLMFSYEINGKVFTYPFMNFVDKVIVSSSEIKFTLVIGEKGFNSNLNWGGAYECEVTIKNSSKDFTNGIEGNITVESSNWFADEKFGKSDSQKASLFTPMANKKINDQMGLIINFTDAEGLKEAINKNLKPFLTSHLRMNKQVTYYYNENSFLNIENPDKYLNQESVQFNKIGNDGSKDLLGVIEDNEYVELVLSIDSATDATDEYVGAGEKRLLTLILPDEFKSLSPMTQEADGLAFSKGRVTRKQFVANTALFSFSDSTECLIPNPEDKTFQAKDKNGQILKGNVVEMTLKEGNSSDALRKQLAKRKKDNLNKSYSFDIDGKYNLDSIAWVTGRKNDFIKMIIPTQENGKEVFKVVNINIGEL
jgi:hypothetical protein